MILESVDIINQNMGLVINTNPGIINNPNPGIITDFKRKGFKKVIIPNQDLSPTLDNIISICGLTSVDPEDGYQKLK